MHEMRMTACMTIGDIEERVAFNLSSGRFFLLLFWFLIGRPDSFAAWYSPLELLGVDRNTKLRGKLRQISIRKSVRLTIGLPGRPLH